MRLNGESSGYQNSNSDFVRPIVNWNINSPKHIRLQQNDEKRTSGYLMVQALLGPLLHRTVAVLQGFPRSSVVSTPSLLRSCLTQALQESQQLRYAIDELSTPNHENSLATDLKIVSQKGLVYRRIRTLGKGGNGVAILCISETPPYHGARLVLKILLKPGGVNTFRFENECEFLSRQQHPNLAPLFSVGEINQDAGIKPYFASQFFPLTLHEVIKSEGVDDRQKLKFAVQLLSAVVSLGIGNYVHRDIKPKNIFVVDDNLVLGDFGLIKNVTDPIPNREDDVEAIYHSLGKEVGALNYMTPDIMDYCQNNVPLTTATDVYQAALVVYELFKSKRWHKPRNRGKPIEFEAWEPPSRPIEAAIDPILQGMLEESPATRLPAADALEQLLELSYRENLWRKDYNSSKRIIESE